MWNLGLKSLKFKNERGFLHSCLCNKSRGENVYRTSCWHISPIESPNCFTSFKAWSMHTTVTFLLPFSFCLSCTVKEKKIKIVLQEAAREKWKMYTLEDFELPPRRVRWFGGNWECWPSLCISPHLPFWSNTESCQTHLQQRPLTLQHCWAWIPRITRQV